MGGFYPTLPSGSSFDFFPKNTLTNFTTKLYEAVDLKGEFECGVVEISYSHTYYIVEDGELTLTKIVHDSQDDTSDIPTLTDFTIPGSNYCTIKGLLSVLNNVAPTHLPEALISERLQKVIK